MKLYAAFIWEPGFMTPDLLASVYPTSQEAWASILPEGMDAGEFRALQPILKSILEEYGNEETRFGITVEMVQDFFEDDDPEPNIDHEEEYDAWYDRMDVFVQKLSDLPEGVVYEFDTDHPRWTMILGQGSFM